MRSIILFGLVVFGGLGLAGCFGRSDPPPTTTSVPFATVTPGGTEVTQLSSPTVFITPTEAVTPPTSTPVPTLTPTATPLVVTATPLPNPQAVIDSPNGFLNIRNGPGLSFTPPIGTYDNGAVAQVIGKQYDVNGDLWWLIRFASGVSDRGWVYAGYTVATNVDNVPWVTAPPLPTAIIITPQPTPTAHAIVNSPNGFLAVRSGPGRIYEPQLGAYNNGATVPLIGKQFSPDDGRLWWLIPFATSPNGQGWIFANYTEARYSDNVPWINPPPTPTRRATSTATHTPTSTRVPVVTWKITGRIVDSTSGQGVGGASVQAILGSDGTTLLTVADGNGSFSLNTTATDAGDLRLTISANGYIERTVTAARLSPREYDFAKLELTPQAAPKITWAIRGRITEIGLDTPIPAARVEAILGDDDVRVTTTTGANGDFTVSGEASDRGILTLNLTADGYQSKIISSDQTDTRIYNFTNLEMVPLAGSCAYESVINLPEISALARLQSLNFSSVSTTTVTIEDQSLVGLVLIQQPDPPPEGETRRISCQLPITLGIGFIEEASGAE